MIRGNGPTLILHWTRHIIATDRHFDDANITHQKTHTHTYYINSFAGEMKTILAETNRQAAVKHFRGDPY